MSGFSAEWLALREPADHRARDPALRAEVVARFSQVPALHVTDFGCGSGSNLRALAPHLSGEQHWHLVDYDPALLQAASDALGAWADRATLHDDGHLDLAIEGRRVLVSFHQVDLDADLETALDIPTHLVTAAAFFDLVSQDWIERFVEACVRRKLPLYTVLTYDGQETWLPAHAADAEVLSAFHAHQARDKGFGAAAGPRATGLLARAFAQCGWQVMMAASAWRLGSADGALITALAQGAAAAVAETGQVSPERLGDWLAARRSATACDIGHLDLFAVP